ncbi:MAG: F0F1 ATP synthase subunit B [Patescibacteria group bacterium]
MINNLVTQFASETAPAEEAGGFGALGIDPKAFVIQFLTFLIVFYVLKRYVFAKVVDILDKRQQTLEQGIKSAQDMTTQKEKLEKEVAKLKTEARAQADDILRETRAQSEDILSKAELSATAKTDKMIDDAKKKIVEESERSRRNLKSEIVSLVVDTTEKLIGKKVNSSEDKAIIDDALKPGKGK